MNLPGTLALLFIFFLGIVAVCATRGRLLRVTGLATVIVVSSIAGHLFWQASVWDSGFQQIHVGDSRERVNQLMDRPTADTDGTVGIDGSRRPPNELGPKRVEQYWYYAFFRAQLLVDQF